MGLLTRRDSSRRGSSPLTGLDRKVIRFRRLLEQHGELLDLLADLKDKQSGDYILDRQYIEASLDRAFEGGRRILYDMHVICDSSTAGDYDQLDRLRSLSETILMNTRGLTAQKDGSSGEEADWETLALQELFKDLTRAPDQSRRSEDGQADSGTGEAVPESFADRIAKAHLRAAQWMTDNLPCVSPLPTLILVDEETELFPIQVFLLGGNSQEAGPLRQCLAQEGRVRSDVPLFFPLRYFLEGYFRDPSDRVQVRQRSPENIGKKKGGNPEPQLQLYASEDFLVIRLPSSLPIRLFGCSLSMQQRENLLYLYGMPFPSLLEPYPSSDFSWTKVPFPAHRFTLDGRWLYWALRFSWAQGEERIRMFGQSLARDASALGSGATGEGVDKSFLKGMTVFLREMAMQQKEVGS